MYIYKERDIYTNAHTYVYIEKDIYTYMYTHMRVCMRVYVCIKRERERECTFP